MSAPPTMQIAIRSELMNNPDGLTRRELSERLGSTIRNIQKVSYRMSDVYIDRWTLNSCGSSWVPVLCLSPNKRTSDAPRPEISTTDYRRKQSGFGWAHV